MPIKYRLNLKVLRFLALTVITLLIFCQTPAWGTIGIAEWEISTPGGNTILKSQAFAWQLYAASVSLNFVLLFVFTLTNPSADFLSFMFLAPFGCILLSCIFGFLWLLAQLSLKLVSQLDRFYKNYRLLNRGLTILLTPLLQFIIFVGIFVAGLSLTFSTWEAPFVSFRYFSCELS